MAGVRKVVYHALVNPRNVETYEQTADQAAISIGDAVVTGFLTQRYAVEDRDGLPLTVVTITSQHGVLFGAYEFTGMA